MRVVRMRFLWIGLAVWFAADLVSAFWRTAPHVRADLSGDFHIFMFLLGAWYFSQKIDS